MPMVITTNLASLVAQQNVAGLQAGMVKNYQRLSSGLRITSASDDAAGLSMSVNLSSQASSYAVAERNANNGVSFAQTAEGALSQMTTLVSRMRDLAVEASNGDLSTTDRTLLNTEFLVLRSEIDRLASSTKYNTYSLVAGNKSSYDFQVGIGTNTSDRITITVNSTQTSDLAINAQVCDTTQSASTAIQCLDAALSTLVSRREDFGAATNRLTTAIGAIQAMKTNLTAAASHIRDLDVADEMATLTRNQVLVQAGSAVLAQANQVPQLALTLFR